MKRDEVSVFDSILVFRLVPSLATFIILNALAVFNAFAPVGAAALTLEIAVEEVGCLNSDIGRVRFSENGIGFGIHSSENGKTFRSEEEGVLRFSRKGKPKNKESDNEIFHEVILVVTNAAWKKLQGISF
ncbi:MAG: hypothetical protein ACJAZC_001652 [Cryomorphaceae bacterium]